jgi:hypothetical protein
MFSECYPLYILLPKAVGLATNLGNNNQREGKGRVVTGAWLCPLKLFVYSTTIGVYPNARNFARGVLISLL